MAETPGTTPSDIERSMVTTLIPTETPSETGKAEGSTEEVEQVTAAEGTQEIHAGPTPTEATETEATPGEPAAKGKKTLGYDELLPLEQGEEYPDELYAIAARKWKIDPKLLEDESVRGLIRDKINSDIEIKRQRLEGQAREEREPGKTAEEPPPAETPGRTLTQTFEEAGSFVEPMLTSDGAAIYAAKMGEAWQQHQEAVESGDPKALEKAQRNVTKVEMQLLAMGLQTMLPAMIPGLLDNYVAGRQAEADESTRVYSKARELVVQDPAFAEVNELYDKGEFRKLLEELPDLLEMRFTKDGKPLPPLENAVAQYKYAVRLIRGRNRQSPGDSFQKGIEARKKQEEKDRQMAGVGKGLGQGRTASGKFTPAGLSDDEHQQKVIDSWNREHPFSGSAPPK